MSKFALLIGRIFLGQIFLLAGIAKIVAFGDYQDSMWDHDIPGALLPLVIWLEFGAGLALIIGWNSRLAAQSLAGFSVITALILHSNFGDQTQTILFIRDLAISGGLLIIATFGPGAFNLNSYLNSKKPKPRRQIQHEQPISFY